MLINGLQKLTLLDFPGQIACTIFTLGCNLRCPFCQNKSLVVPEHFETGTLIPLPQVFDFLQERKDKLQGVCITGGEPTLQSDLIDFIIQIKDLGYKIKLDTNGTKPDVLKTLFDKHLLDYVAMDIKSDKDTYAMLAGNNIDWNNLQTSINLIKQSSIPYEFRTTVVKPLHNETIFQNIAKMLGHVTNYSLQYYQESDDVIQPIYQTPSDQEMTAYQHILQTCADHVVIKGR